MKTDNYWTGLADVTSQYTEARKDIKGAIYRVITFAESYEAFVQKVEDVLCNSGDVLLLIEEPESLTAFLKNGWLEDDHEIYEMFDQAEISKNDVVSGEIQHYGYEED